MAPPSTNDSPTVAANPPSESSSPAAAGDPQSATSPGRPRALTREKRREFLSLIASGLGVEHAARHLGCSPRTIRREMKRDVDFAFEVECNELAALLNPMKALFDIAQENWRAAAWLLERLFPERFGRRPQTTAFGKRQARQLLKEVLSIVDAEVIDMPQRDWISGRIRATFEYFTHVYCERKRSKSDLHLAVELFENKDKPCDLEWLASSCKSNFSPTSDPGIAKQQSPADTDARDRSRPAPSPRRGPLSAPSPRRGRDQTSTGDPKSPERSAVVNRVAKGRGDSAPPKTISEAFQDLIDELKDLKKASRSKDGQNKTQTDEVLSPTTSAGAFAEDKMDKTITPQCAEYA